MLRIKGNFVTFQTIANHMHFKFQQPVFLFQAQYFVPNFIKSGIFAGDEFKIHQRKSSDLFARESLLFCQDVYPSHIKDDT